MNRRRRKNTLARLIVSLALTAVTALTVFIIIEVRITPVLNAMAESRAKNIASEAVNDAVQRVLCEKNLRYENLVNVTTNDEDMITSVTVDSVEMNRLCAEIRGIITDTLNSLGERTVSIPIGSLTGIDMFTGKGPRLDIAVTLSGSATTGIVNDFRTAGINQTRHQMILEVKTKVYAITQNGNISTEISNSIVVAETVIVGEVPEIYSDGSDDLWQNVMDYGETD